MNADVRRERLSQARRQMLVDQEAANPGTVQDQAMSWYRGWRANNFTEYARHAKMSSWVR